MTPENNQQKYVDRFRWINKECGSVQIQDSLVRDDPAG